MTKQNLLVVGVVIALVFGLNGSFKEGKQGPAGRDGRDFTAGAATTNQPAEPYYFQGGFTSKIAGFNGATSTVACAIQNTTNATTTFRARLGIRTATTTATAFSLATSTNENRWSTTTTTVILSKSFAANIQGTSAYNGANEQNIIGPGEWVKWVFSAGTHAAITSNGGSNQVGSCAVDFGIIF